MRKLILGFLLGIIFSLTMASIDLSPKMKLRPAEQELVTEYRPGERPLGETIGGLQMFSNVFKRGYGDKVFGSDENGIWLGGSDFENGKFKVSMSGDAELRSATFRDKDNVTFIDAYGLVGNASFSSDNKTMSGNVSVSNGSWSTVDGLTYNISLTRQTPILMYGTIMFTGGTVGTGIWFRILVNSTVYPNPDDLWQGTVISANNFHTLGFNYAAVVPAGNNTISFQAKGNSSNMEIIEGSNFGYVILGK